MDKQTLGLSAEFAVASELCRRDIYAQLTLGLRKSTDILIETETGMLKIQVKGKKGKHWPAVKGISGKDMFLIFVDFENKQDTDRPDFYILNFEDWNNLAKNIYDNHNDPRYKIELDENYRISYKKAGGNKVVWTGADIKLVQVKDFNDKWEKIKSIATA
jgi:hypothetical protein